MPSGVSLFSLVHSQTSKVSIKLAVKHIVATHENISRFVFVSYWNWSLLMSQWEFSFTSMPVIRNGSFRRHKSICTSAVVAMYTTVLSSWSKRVLSRWNFTLPQYFQSSNNKFFAPSLPLSISVGLVPRISTLLSLNVLATQLSTVDKSLLAYPASKTCNVWSTRTFSLLLISHY